MPKVIKVPRPSSSAWNPARPLHKNLLIAAQVRHFEEAEQHLPAHLRTGVAIHEIRTEGEASEYIRKVTRAIHQSGGRKAPKVETAR